MLEEEFTQTVKTDECAPTVALEEERALTVGSEEEGA